MTIKYASLNHINHRDSSIRDINITHSDSLKEYTDKLFKEITDSPRKRQYIFSSSKSEVRNVLDDIVTDNNRKKSINLAAQRLLNKEKDAQQQLDNKKLKVDILSYIIF